MARKKAGDSKVAVGNIRDVSGEINIAAGDIYKGFTAEQVSALLKQITSTFQAKKFDGRCPYKGLDVFEEEDAELFFGREKLIDDLVSRVKESRTVFITGPSGSGKSSLVRAGLIHALKQGAIKNSKSWLYETMKPGRDPIEALALVFSRLKSPELAKYFREHINESNILHECAESVLSGRKDQRLVLFIDQFEEVFTQVGKEKAEEFIDILTTAATLENGRVILLFSMRSDFVSNCATYPQLNALLNQQFIQIGAMQPGELVSAIAQPALRVGLRIDPDLIAQIINEMEGEPGALPLMQFALKDLFDAQEAKGGVITLTLTDYLQRGGIHKALERHADDSFAKLDKNEQELARSIFSGLIEIGRGTQDTRRTALFDELIPAHTKAENLLTIVQKLADARLITTDEQVGRETVTLAHEKLIDAWPWLKKLVNENRDAIALQNEITNDANEWEENKQDASYLYRGARLSNAREQLEAKKLMLSETANRFVRMGLTRQRRAQVSVTGGISIIIFFLIAAVIIFATLTKEAQKQAKIARTKELAAQAISQRDKNFPLSLLLGVESFQMMDLPITRGTLLDNTMFNPQLIQYLFGHSDCVCSLAFNPDGKILASGSFDNSIILWDAETHRPIGEPLKGHDGFVNSVAFSPDGKTLASGSNDKTIILWDVETHQPIGKPFKSHGDSVSSVTFSPDGKTLASGSNDKTVILWDVETHQPIGEPLKGGGWVFSIAFSPDGKILASGSDSNAIILWDVETHQPIGEPLKGHDGDVNSLAFSPNGKTLASGSDDSTIILWDVETRQPIGEPLKGHVNLISSVAFSPDGKILASGSNDKTIILWDVETRQPIGETLKGYGNPVYSVAFSPDGKIVASDSGKNTIIFWDVETHQPIGEPLKGHASEVNSVAFSPNGKTLASASFDNTIILWDVKTHQQIGEPLIGIIVIFSPDGKTLASGRNDETIMWDIETRQPIGEPIKDHGMAFSPNGRILASVSRNNAIVLWDVETHQPIGEPLKGHREGVSSVTFSPDGKTLASGSDDETIILWDMDTHQPIGEPLKGHSGWITSVVFSPDGKTLASASFDNTIILWDAETHQQIGELLKGYSAWTQSLALSPDDKMLGSSGSDETIISWDAKHPSDSLTISPLLEFTSFIESVAFSQKRKFLASGESSNSNLIAWDIGNSSKSLKLASLAVGGGSCGVCSIIFSPDGKILASGSGDGTVILWDVNPLSWIQKNCQRTGRNFTQDEWKRYFPNEEYRITCPQWPAGQ